VNRTLTFVRRVSKIIMLGFLDHFEMGSGKLSFMIKYLAWTLTFFCVQVHGKFKFAYFLTQSVVVIKSGRVFSNYFQNFSI